MEIGDNIAEAAAMVGDLESCDHAGDRQFDREARALLACIAPFLNVINTDLLPHYAKLLAAEQSLAGLPFDRLTEVVETARAFGLLQREGARSPLLCPHPALTRSLTNRLSAPKELMHCAAIERAFCRLYREIAGLLLAKLQSKQPEERELASASLRREYANLGTALYVSLERGDPVLKVYLIVSSYLDRLPNAHRAIELGELILLAQERRPREWLTRESAIDVIGIVGHIAGRHLAYRRLDEAKASYERALVILDRIDGLDPKFAARARAGILQQLSMIAEERRRFEEAKRFYQQALEIESAADDPAGQAGIYDRLGIVAREQRRFAEAEEHYNNALAMKAAVGDRQGAAVTYGELGNVVYMQRRFEEAGSIYRKALETFLAVEDRRGAAGTYRQLGIVARERWRFAEAEAHFKNALEIWIAAGDRRNVAMTYAELGNVIYRQHRSDEAEDRYRTALDLFLAANDRHSAATTYHQLGGIAHNQRRLAQAEGHYRKALELFLSVKARYGAGTVLRSLDRLWKEGQRNSVPATVARSLKIDLDAAKRALADPLEYTKPIATASTRGPAVGLRQAVRGSGDSGPETRDP